MVLVDGIECRLKIHGKWLRFYIVLLLLLIVATVVIPLYIENMLFTYASLIALIGVTSSTLLLFVVVYVKIWSRGRPAEASVRRGWLFLKVWGGRDYFELLPRRVGRVDDVSIEVIGDPWRFRSQAFVIRFNSPDDAYKILKQLQEALRQSL